MNSRFRDVLLASALGVVALHEARAQTASDGLRSSIDVNPQSSPLNIDASPSAVAIPTSSEAPVANTPNVLNQPSRRGLQGRQNLPVTSVGPGQLINVNGELRPLANQRTEPSQGTGGRFDETPFSPTGLRLGNFLLFPVFEQSLGYTTNANQTADGDGSAFSQTDGRLRFQSDWSVHQLRGEIGASTIQYFSGDADALNAADANAEFRLDIRRGWAARLGANYALTAESVTSERIDLAPGQVVTDRPVVQTYGGFAAIEHAEGRLGGSLRASLERSDFGDVDLADGSSASQNDRNQVEAKATLRLAYELSPALSPFVEASYGNRMFDQDLDADGISRNATLIDFRAGAAFDLGDKVRGELALGYGLENYDDGALPNLDGFTINGSLAWSPEQLTTITATAETQLNGAGGLADTGSITYAAALAAERRVRSNLAINGRLGAAWRDYESNREDTTWQAQLGATWYFNRTWALIGQLGYERVNSTDANSTYDAATARLGLRFQR